MTKKWDEHKAVIVSLYLEQSKPLHEVQRIMEEEHNFKASTRAYRTRFDKWAIYKYNCRRSSDDSGAQGSVSAASPPGVDIRGSPAAVTPPMRTGTAEQPDAPLFTFHGFGTQRPQAYPTPPVSVDGGNGSGMDTQQGGATGPARTPSISQPYQSHRGSPTVLSASPGQSLDFYQQAQGSEYFGALGQFRPPCSTPYHQSGHHLQGEMCCPPPVADFLVLSTQAPAATFRRPPLNRCS